MRVAFRLFVLVCLAEAGCTSLRPRSPVTPSQNAPPLGRAHASVTPSADLAPEGPDPAASAGLLAGQVIDSTSAGPLTTFVQVAEGGGGAAPIVVPADARGYFTIRGLQPGRPYLLTARAQTNGRVLVGTTTVTPPNARVLIQVVPDLAMAAAPPHKEAPGPTEAAADKGWAPGRSPRVAPEGAATPTGPRRPAELGSPIPLPPGSRAPGQPRPRPQDIAQDAIVRQDVPLDIHGPASVSPASPQSPAGWDAIPPGAPRLGPAPVPSCLLTGQTLQNFALNDLSGQPWEFRQHQGRVVLLDFWGTWCLHCQHAIPHLKDLQYRYGPYGLEVIGIAYEEGAPQDQVQKVSRVRNRLGMNYRVLMGSDRATCPVRTQFQVRSWPTLVLLDDQGRIIWRGEGFDAEQIRELEIIIRQRLGMR